MVVDELGLSLGIENSSFQYKLMDAGFERHISLQNANILNV